MLSSSIYHLFNSMSRDHYLFLLKVDLIGIGFKITGLSVTLIYKGFHYFSSIGSPLAIVLGLMMTSNLLLQLTPCYMHDAYEKHRLLFYVILIISLFGVAVSWVSFIASTQEMEIFFARIMLSFAFIGIGFFFYSSGWPERRFTGYWI